jgi:predicted transposase/invertase (TIGR01784 family)
MKFADITNDIAFRKIFGNQNKKKTLVSFLNAVLNFPKDEQIVDVEITNPYQLGRLSGGNVTIVDVQAEDEKGKVFIVELEIADEYFFHKEILPYILQDYASRIEKVAEFTRRETAYFIGILEFEIGKNPAYFSRHKVLDVETNEHVIQDVEFHLIELPKFDKTIDQLESSIDQWTYFIKNAKNLKLIPDSVSDEGLKEAYIEADRHQWSKLELEDYERVLIKQGEEMGTMTKAIRQAEERGEKRGEEIGEKKNQEKVARYLLQNGMSIELIVGATGLTKEEIAALRPDVRD